MEIVLVGFSSWAAPIAERVLVAAMLGAHPEVYSIPFETAAFRAARNAREARSLLKTAARECDKPQAKYICEKTPRHVCHANEILRAYKRAKFVVVVRDPRDVACSLKRRKGSLKPGVKQWRSHNEHALRLLTQPMAFQVRYEELVTDVEGVLSKLCAFIGLGYESAMLDYWKDDRDWFGASERRELDGSSKETYVILRNWQIHQPLMRDRVGIFRRELNAEEIATIEQELGSLAPRLGYLVHEQRS